MRTDYLNGAVRQPMDQQLRASATGERVLSGHADHPDHCLGSDHGENIRNTWLAACPRDLDRHDWGPYRSRVQQSLAADGPQAARR